MKLIGVVVGVVILALVAAGLHSITGVSPPFATLIVTVALALVVAPMSRARRRH